MTTVQKRLIGVLAVLVVLGGAWKLLLEPAAQDRSTAREELASAQAAETTALASLQTARTAERRLPENQRVLRALARVVPAQPESAALLDRLDALARRSDVRFDSLELAGADGTATAAAAAPAEATAAAGKAGAQEIPVALKLSGSYPRVVSLLRRMHGRGADLGGQRLLKLSQVKLTPDEEEDSGGRLSAEVTAVAFVMADAAAPTADATTAPADGTAAPADDATTATAPGGTG